MITRTLYFEESFLNTWQKAKANKVEYINLSKNQFTAIDFPTFEMPDIQILELSYNETEIEKLVIDAAIFPNLEYIFAYKSNIKSFEIKGNLPKLKEINLGENLLKEFQLQGNFQSMQTLFLYKNPIANIPKEFFDKEQKNVWIDVRNFFIALAQGQIINIECKGIWVGNGESGKTTLSYQLRNNKFIAINQKDRTHGILIKEWIISISELPNYEFYEKFREDISNTGKGNLTIDEQHSCIQEKIDIIPDGIIKKFLQSSLDIHKEYQTREDKSIYDFIDIPSEYNFIIRFWDFGGQEYYHATHRLFLSNNALYFLVWDEETNKQDEEKGIYPLEYWQESIKNYAPTNKVFEIQNKAKQNCNINPQELKYKTHFRTENQKDIQKYEIDIDDLKEGIFSQLHHLDYLAKLFPKVYDDIRKKLRTQTDVFLTFDDYVAFCQKNDLTSDKILNDLSQIQSLTEFLHETGAIICYRYKKDVSENLKNYVFLNPIWVSGYIYQILSKEVIDKNGEFNLGHIKKQINQPLSKEDYPEFSYLENSGIEAEVWVDLMKEFELIFEKKEKEFVCPQYLPKKCEDLSEKALKNLKEELPFEFTLHYPKFLSKSVISRFISKYGNLAKDFYWKYGIVIHKEKEDVKIKALVIADYTQENRKSICVKSNDVSIFAELFETFFSLSNEKEDIELYSSEKQSFKTIKEIKEYKEIYKKEFWFIFPNEFTNGEKKNNPTKKQVEDMLPKYETFRDTFQVSTTGQTPDLIREIRKEYLMDNTDKGTFEEYVEEFISRNDNFNFEKWKVKVITFLDNLMYKLNEEHKIKEKLEYKEIKIPNMNATNIPESFITELKKQISDEYVMIADTNLRRSVTRDTSKKQEYEDLISSCEDNIAYSEKKFLQRVQNQNQNISENEVKKLILELKEEIKKGFENQNIKMKELFKYLEESHKPLLIEILQQRSNEELALIKQMYDKLSEVKASEANVFIDEISENLPANLPQREAIQVQLNSMEVTANGKLKLAIPLIPSILSYEIEIGKQWTEKIPKVWQAIVALFKKKA